MYFYPHYNEYGGGCKELFGEKEKSEREAQILCVCSVFGKINLSASIQTYHP